MNKPLVSIITPTHNGAKYIRRAIKSVLDQTYQNIEVVIVNDGSTDETAEIIAQFIKEDSRVSTLVNETNIGFVKSLNRAIKATRGKYISRIDDDDFWCDSEKLDKQVAFLEAKPDYVLIGSGMIKIDDNSKEIARYLFPEKDEDIRKSILVDNLLSHGTVLFRKDALEKVGGYSEEFGFFADMDLSMKLGKMGKFYNFQEYFACYLDKELFSSYSLRNRDIRRKLKLNLQLRKMHSDTYPGRRRAYLFCLASYVFSFLPIREKLRPILVKIRSKIIGPPAYKYFTKQKTEIIIKPKKGLASIDFRELWRYRELFYFFAWRDIKVRYKQTFLGAVWAILQPFLTMVVFTVIFGKLANMPSDNIPYPIFVYAGLLLWNIFSNSLTNAGQSLIGSVNLIQKVYLPRIIVPAASIIVTLVDFFFATLIFGGIMIYYRFMPNFKGLVLFPLLLLIIVTVSLGLGLFLAAFSVKYRDVRYASPFFIQLLIFLTPVIYPVSIVPRSYQWILALNPMTGAIQTFKTVFLGTGSIDWMILSISATASVVFLIIGLAYFLKTEKTFADII